MLCALFGSPAPTVRRPVVRFAVAAAFDEIQKLGVADRGAVDQKRARFGLMPRPFVVERRGAAVAPHGERAGRDVQHGVGRGRKRRGHRRPGSVAAAEGFRGPRCRTVPVGVVVRRGQKIADQQDQFAVLLLVLQQHVQDAPLAEQRVIVTPISPLQKGERPFPHAVEIGNHFARRGQPGPLRFGGLERREQRLVAGVQRRGAPAPLQDPERLGDGDVPEVPARRTEFGVYLPTEIPLVEVGEQGRGVRSRGDHPALEVGHVNHAASGSSSASTRRSAGLRNVRMPPSGTVRHAGWSDSFSEATTTAPGNSGSLQA